MRRTRPGSRDLCAERVGSGEEENKEVEEDREGGQGGEI